MYKLANILGYFLSIDQLYNLIGNLKDIERNKFNKAFKVVRVYNHSGDISIRIFKETGFNCNWEGKQGYIGINKIIIPVEKYTEELALQLIKKYDSFVNN